MHCSSTFNCFAHREDRRLPEKSEPAVFSYHILKKFPASLSYPSLVDKSEIGGELQFKHLSENLKTTGFRSVEYKGVTVEILRKTPHVTDSGWIGPDHPSTATEEWGKEMLETTANYIVDFMEEFKKVKLS